MNRKAVLIFITLLFTLALSACGNGSSGNGGGEGNVGITLIKINAASDSFVMGDGTYGPDVTQTISYNFRMSKHEITNAQFQAFIDDGGYSTSSYWTTNGWNWKTNNSITGPDGTYGSGFYGPNQPVVGVSWYEAVAFSNWLSVKEVLTPAYNSSGQIVNLSANGYRLPTEVEWEYAAAKGQPGASERIYAWGDAWDCANAVSNVSPCNNSATANVGSTSPNGDTPQGLADMSGNVSEWISDDANLIISGSTDWYSFVDDNTGRIFVIRGGTWSSGTGEGEFRSAYRFNSFFDGWPNVSGKNLGFRVVRPIPLSCPVCI